MKIEIESRFGVGDTIHEVFYCDEIAAWKVDSWKVHNIVVTAHGDGRVTFGYNTKGIPEIIVGESDLLFTSGLAAVNEAQRRNLELRGQ